MALFSRTVRANPGLTGLSCRVLRLAGTPRGAPRNAIKSGALSLRGFGSVSVLRSYRGEFWRNQASSVSIVKRIGYLNIARTASMRMCSSCSGLGVTNVPPREVLPTHVKPLEYHLTLEPNFKDFTFTGDLVIDLEVKEAKNSVTLNSNEIDISSSSVVSGGVEQKATDISYNKDLETVTITFEKDLQAGAQTALRMSFTGILNDKMAGFYRSTYTDEKGETKYLATTQMEPTDCRRAFPSFDEPALKAHFSITLIADEKLTCLSNMDVKETKKLSGGRKAVSFNQTPLMSTYLVAFIVGDLKYVETQAFRIPIRVYATPGLEEQGRFSVELAAKTLEFFEKKFDIPFPLPKMDMVAIHDFSAGAMENWGLITYRVVDLLFDEENASLSTKQRVAEVVQHELAHQWFGNLVTMDWWEGLWLNEGFATWMSWFSCNEFYPDWKVWEQYVTDNLQSALTLDGLRSSHPIEVPVKRADEINQIFDAISYSKGSAVLKMVSEYLGEDVFIRGVSNYLKKHAYGNTQTSDLWSALAEASGKDVQSVMDIWTKKVGYPVVSVTEHPESKEITLKQNRYLTTGDVKPEEDETIYPVFLGLKTKKGTDESLVLDKRESKFQLDDLEFYKINANQAGIYRTSYPKSRWEKLSKAGVEGLLSVEDRAGLVADIGALSVSGYQPTVNLLSLVSQWKSESEFVVWDEIISRIGAIRVAWIFEEESVKTGLKNFTRDLVAEKVQSVGWEFKPDDTFLEQQLKSLLFSASAGAEDAKVVAICKDLFAKYVAGDKKAIHPNLRASVFGNAIKFGGLEEWEALLNIYKNPISMDEKNTAMRSLGRSNKPELIEKTLALLLDGTVRAQDIYLPMAGLRTHPEGIVALWKWMTSHWDEIYKLLPPGLSMLSSVVSLCTSGYLTREGIAEVKKFFADKNTKGFDQGLAQSLDSMTSKVAWVERDRDELKAWLAEKGYLNAEKI